MFGGMRRLALSLVLALACGCQTVSYRTGLAPTGQRYEARLDYYVLGLVGEHEIDLDLVCPTGQAAWRSRHSAMDVLFSIVTLGIWTPRTVTVECGVKR